MGGAEGWLGVVWAVHTPGYPATQAGSPWGDRGPNRSAANLWNSQEGDCQHPHDCRPPGGGPPPLRPRL